MPVPGAVSPMAAEPTTEYQTQVLKAQAEQMEKTLEQIRKRIADLESMQSEAR